MGKKERNEGKGWEKRKEDGKNRENLGDERSVYFIIKVVSITMQKLLYLYQWCMRFNVQKFIHFSLCRMIIIRVKTNKFFSNGN